MWELAETTIPGFDADGLPKLIRLAWFTKFDEAFRNRVEFVVANPLRRFFLRRIDPAEEPVWGDPQELVEYELKRAGLNAEEPSVWEPDNQYFEWLREQEDFQHGLIR